MIPGSKLTDIWAPQVLLFARALAVYGVGALVAALAPVLGILILGYSLLQGVGSALMIPPIYILVTVCFTPICRPEPGLSASSAPPPGLELRPGHSLEESLPRRLVGALLLFSRFLVVAFIFCDRPQDRRSWRTRRGPQAGRYRSGALGSGTVLCGAWGAPIRHLSAGLPPKRPFISARSW